MVDKGQKRVLVKDVTVPAASVRKERAKKDQSWQENEGTTGTHVGGGPSGNSSIKTPHHHHHHHPLHTHTHVHTYMYTVCLKCV